MQMYVTGFITVVVTPMMGPDVALGAADALHCYSAMIYVFDHVLANQYLLGVGLLSPNGLGFAVSSSLCGVCQFLRAEDNRAARVLYVRALGSKRMSFTSFIWLLELVFMLTENALFFIFLFGMTSGMTPTLD